MKRFLIMLLVPFLCISHSASAQEMSQDQMLVECKKIWKTVSDVNQCVANLRIAAAEKRDEEILKRLDALTQSIDKLVAMQQRPAVQPAAPTAKSEPPAPQVAATSAVSYVRTGGVAWAPVHQPTVVSIHSLTRMAADTLHITDLEHPTARSTCGGVGAPLVLFFDHGVPVSNVYTPAGAPTGFREVYWDRQNDGIPDGTVWALDLESQNDVWITWGQANDLTIRYLRPGDQIAIDGLPLQTVYHPTQKNEASGSGAIGCDRDILDRRGGHQVVPGYSLSRMW